MEAHPAEILDVEQQRTLMTQGLTEATKLARERYGIDLSRVARDPAEAVALVRAYAADALLDTGSNRQERGAAAMLLLNASGQKAREQTADRERRTGIGGAVRKALFGGDSRETGS